MDEPLRLRLDVDVRGDDNVAIGVASSGPPMDPSRAQSAALLLAAALAQDALRVLPDDRRAEAGARLEEMTPAELAGTLQGRLVDGVEVADLRPGEQVGARGVCARLVLYPGNDPLEALTSVDVIGMDHDSVLHERWAAVVPALVPRLLVRAGAGEPMPLARGLVALRALGRAARHAPASLDEPRLARRAVDEAAAGDPIALAQDIRMLQAARTGPGEPRPGWPPPAAGDTRPLGDWPPPSAQTRPLGAVRQAEADEHLTRPLSPAEPLAPAVAPRPSRGQDGSREGRRALVVAVVAVALAVLSTGIAVAMAVSPGSFGLVSSSELSSRVDDLESQVSAARADVARAVAAGQGQDVEALRQALSDADQRLGTIEDQVGQICDVLAFVC